MTRPMRSMFGGDGGTAQCITLAITLAALAVLPLHAQDGNVYSLHAFMDTASVRIEFERANSADLVGARMRGRILSATDSSVLWSGDVGTVSVDARGTARLSARVGNLRPRRWSPQTPALYHLVLDAATASATMSVSTRIGFRTMSARNGQLLLNGRPIFLKGNAINPPERQVPDSLEENRQFVESYVRYLKSVGVNIIRLTRHSQMWFDVCDELGMMLFQGNYGTPQAGKPTEAPTRPFAESLDWYKRTVIGPLVNHPSVTVYVLANEQADKEIGYLSTGAAGVHAFLEQAYDSLRAWDDTRVYIANAGYGFGRTGDVCDLHRYWGWYYNSFLSFYTMRYPATCWRTPVAQPMTMTENTGNYTGVDGRFNLVSNTKQPDSQLNWTGHAPDSEQATRALWYQAWMGGQAIEIYRRAREQNPNLAGITPFTILFHNWHGITRFEDMKPKPLGAQYRTSYQPVLLSWENWASQAYAGSTIRPVAHVVNDHEQGRDLRKLAITWYLIDSAGTQRLRGQRTLPDVPYYAAKSASIAVALPANLPTGRYTLHGVLYSGAEVLSRNETPVFVAGSTWPATVNAVARRVVLFDPSRRSEGALRRVGVRAATVRDMQALSSSRDLLVLGAEAWGPELARQVPALRQFVRDGGRLLVLHQDYKSFDGAWLPVPIRLQSSELDHALVFPGGRPFRNGMSVNPERPGHPALAGIDRDRLFLWSDFTGWNETKPGFPQVYPVTRGFVLTDPATFGRAAVLANYDHGLQGVGLAELFDGTGSVMVSGFDLVSRSRRDPVADRMLANLVRYMAGAEPHEATPMVTERIVWGNYATEHGIVTGVYNGLLVNTVPVMPKELEPKYPITVDAEGFVLAGGAGGWNTKPAIQYVARGRRPFGPFTFTSGGSVQVPKEHAGAGEGRVWLRIPQGRTMMTTTVENPVAVPLDLELTVNGATQRVRVEGRETKRIETAVQGGAQPLSIGFRGDRRLVLLETDFR